MGVWVEEGGRREGEGRAPIFLQFVDCVWQMTMQVCVCVCVGGGGGEEGGGGQGSHLSPVCGLCVADDSAAMCVWCVGGGGRGED